MNRRGNLRWVVATGVALLALMPNASAEDQLKVASAQRGAWESAAAELGQQAGFFKKHGIVLELIYTQSSGETEQRVIAGGADVGLAVGAMAVMRDYSRGAPVRIIGAGTTGAPAYWYVLMSSPIQTIKDLVGRSIAYATNGSSSHYDALDLIKQHRLKARLIATGDTAAALNQLTQGHIDVAWAAPPFGIDELEQGKIRAVARANDVSTVRGKTVSVIITHANTLERRKGVLARFMQAYRETVEWMYSDPVAVKRYAELAGVSEGVAQRLRNEFHTKDMLSPDQIVGLKAIMKDAVALRYLQTRLSRKQIAELIQIPPPLREGLTNCRDAVGCGQAAAVVSP
jgi:ABC-type nitrate/sulfonate/bicarbonate transport system substrate-binding protein